MKREAPQRPRLSDVLYEDLLNEISSGKLPAGSRLPSESDLCSIFSVSRPIVREALGKLREEGIIRSRKGSGSFVAPAIALSPNREVLRRRVASIADVQRLYDFRVAVEGEIAAIAAAQRTPEQLEAIEVAADQLGKASQQGAVGTREDVQFHRAIALATNNYFFVDVLDRIAPDMAFIVELARTLLVRQPTQSIERVQSEHMIIVQAVAEQKPDVARERMQFHIRTAQSRLFFGDGEEGAALWQAMPPV